MKNGFHKKKFLLNEPMKKLDEKTELLVLENMLKKAEQEENYELAMTIFGRIDAIKKSRNSM